MTSTGVVKCYYADKGFGFIKPDVAGKDLFVHASDVKRAGLIELVQGQRLEFSAEATPRGPRATNLVAVA